MNSLTTIALSAALLAMVAVSPAMAGDSDLREKGLKRGVTPYGAYCRSPYGACREQLEIHEAVVAMEDYFNKKGMSVEVLDHSGRFIKADVLKNGKKVDCIILDRKTGRMRSIY